MTRYLLDTKVVSELRRSRAHPAVVRWFAQARSQELYLSVLTIAEIRLGILRLAPRAPDRAGELSAWVDQLEAGYGDRILPVTGAVALRWAHLNRERSLPVVDSLLAATALEHDAVLVTRNTRDLRGVDVPLVDPFG